MAAVDKLLLLDDASGLELFALNFPLMSGSETFLFIVNFRTSSMSDATGDNETFLGEEEMMMLFRGLVLHNFVMFSSLILR